MIEMINRKDNSEGAVKTSGEIFPSETVPVIVASRSKKIMPFAMEWGYSTSDGNRLINAQSETAVQKPTFRAGMLHRRCIVPASWYFEWNRNEKGKPKYAIGAEHRNVIYMAGIYRFQEQPVFSILTRPPRQRAFSSYTIACLPREAVRDWLNTEYAAEEVLQSAALNVRSWLI